MKKIILFYFLSFLLFSLFTFFYIDENFFYLRSLYSGINLHMPLFAILLYSLFISLLYFGYFKILVYAPKIKIQKKMLLLPFIGIFAYPAILSFDLFNYIATAKVAFHYFENPYVIMPIEFSGDPMLLFTHAANKTALYGPLWILLTAIPYYLSFQQYVLSVIFLKLFVGLFFVGTVILLWKLTRSMYNVLFFAANPLVLIETFISGHNDIVMMFLALASVYSLKKNKLLFSIILLVCSILIKYATVFMIPVFLFLLAQIIAKKKVDWDYWYIGLFLSMLFICLLSPLREELYPWYAIWPLTFFSLVAEKKRFLGYIVILGSYGLMLAYIPYMYLWTYTGITPILKNVCIVMPLTLFLSYVCLQRFYRLLS